jgi:amino acid adenylation domain-containing protein
MQLEQPRAIHKLFEQRAGQCADSVALRMAGRTLSYRELDARANFLARHLQSRGVQAGEIVAMRMRRSIEVTISMLAILKCGAAYLPMEESDPVARSSVCLAAANVRVILAEGQVHETLASDRTVISTRDAALFDSMLTTFDSVDVGPDAPAYVMFTSGSTGTPKGVVVPHRAVMRLVVDPNYIDIREYDKVLQFAPLSFDASTFEIWGPLLNGGELVIYSGAVLDPNLLQREIAEYKVTILWLTAALFHLFAEKFVTALFPLRVLLAGGDVLNVKSVNKVLDQIPGLTVINGYGPTENTTFTCCHVMTTNNRPGETVPIGKAISGTEIHVLDERRVPVPSGQEGELFASGLGVALGYLNADDGDAFFHDPNIAPGLIYRTGDLVRRNALDELEFIGRVDSQVKLRGYRVSLGEIKTRIVEMECVCDALVLKQTFGSGEQLLIAHVQLKEGRQSSGRQVQSHLATVLPNYMIPDKILFHSQLPITSNGKLDSRAIQTLSKPTTTSQR